MTQSGQKHSQSPEPQTSGSQTEVEPEEVSHTATPPNSSYAACNEAGLMDLASDWLATTGSRAKVMMELVVAEARLAAISVALMAFLAMLSAAFVLGAWSLLIAGLIYGLIQVGLPIWPILIALCVIHALIAFLAWHGAVKLSNNLEFPATRKQFQQNQGDGDEVAKPKA